LEVIDVDISVLEGGLQLHNVLMVDINLKFSGYNNILQVTSTMAWVNST
jgi:hypothetical protein